MIQVSDILFYYSESAIHAGDGASAGTVDLPIQRDQQTGHPIFRYGTVKGSIRDACRQSWEIAADVQKRAEDVKTIAEVAQKVSLWETIFGPDSSRASEHAGATTFSDARILLFPPWPE
jgi:CRISPR-associated protein Cmr4